MKSFTFDLGVTGMTWVGLEWDLSGNFMKRNWDWDGVWVALM